MRVQRNDLLWSAGLLLTAIGLYVFWGLILGTLVRIVPIWLYEACGGVLQACSFIAIGAAFGAPFKKKTTGAVVGLTVFLLVLLLVHLPGRMR
jgi:hypothetical protein